MKNNGVGLLNTFTGSKRFIGKLKLQLETCMGMGCKVELDNIVYVVAVQAYMSANNKHSCVIIVNRTHRALGL